MLANTVNHNSYSATNYLDILFSSKCNGRPNCLKNKNITAYSVLVVKIVATIQAINATLLLKAECNLNE